MPRLRAFRHPRASALIFLQFNPPKQEIEPNQRNGFSNQELKEMGLPRLQTHFLGLNRRRYAVKSWLSHAHFMAMIANSMKPKKTTNIYGRVRSADYELFGRFVTVGITVNFWFEITSWPLGQGSLGAQTLQTEVDNMTQPHQLGNVFRGVDPMLDDGHKRGGIHSSDCHLARVDLDVDDMLAGAPVEG